MRRAKGVKRAASKGVNLDDNHRKRRQQVLHVSRYFVRTGGARRVGNNSVRLSTFLWFGFLRRLPQRHHEMNRAAMNRALRDEGPKQNPIVPVGGVRPGARHAASVSLEQVKKH